jgi:homospermidine synthase
MNNIIILGFGSIGSGLLPLLLKHVDARKIHVIGGDNRNVNIVAKYGVNYMTQAIHPHNYETILDRVLSKGDMLVNLSVNVSSEALVKYCHDHDVLYLDTCIEPWEGYYTDTQIPPEKRSNYSLRQDILDLRETYRATGSDPGPTAIMAHGANPGLVNHFVKRALIHVAQHRKPELLNHMPHNQTTWCAFAEQLGLKVIHIAERDTQTPQTPKQVGEFVNTWSVDGFISEGLQPSELGWGTHEKQFPVDGRTYEWGCKSAIWLNRPSCSTRVRTWTPQEGAFVGFLITHNESISIADYFSSATYRPTVHYAYHPCDSAVLSVHEMQGKNFQEQDHKRLILDEIVQGHDELGVLLMGTCDGAPFTYWYGSLLDIHTARKLAPHNNATSLQVVAPVLAGILHALENPRLGIVEADDLPHEVIMSMTDPYMGKLVGEWSDWTPLQDRGSLFPEHMDHSDPWQFDNFRVI